MAWFGQGKDTIEWAESRSDVLFYKWPNKEIKKGARLIIRPGQKAIFYSGGKLEGVFEQQGTYDVLTDITPFLSTLSGWAQLRGDTGLRAEIYFVNSKELLIPWGTRQRIMIPSPDVPTGIPVGCNGNLIVEFRDYVTFIEKIAGVKSTFSIDDISERIMGEINGVIAEAILGNNQSIGVNALISLQANNRKLSKIICEELDKELSDIGLGARDVNILSINYPPELQAMAEKVASQSFVTDVGKYASINMADSFNSPNSSGNFAAMGAQMAMGQQMAQQMTQQLNNNNNVSSQNRETSNGEFVCTVCGLKSNREIKFCPECGNKIVPASQNAENSQGDRFCPNCRKMVSGKFCPECGSKTV